MSSKRKNLVPVKINKTKQPKMYPTTIPFHFKCWLNELQNVNVKVKRSEPKKNLIEITLISFNKSSYLIIKTTRINWF